MSLFSGMNLKQLIKANSSLNILQSRFLLLFSQVLTADPDDCLPSNHASHLANQTFEQRLTARSFLFVLRWCCVSLFAGNARYGGQNGGDEMKDKPCLRRRVEMERSHLLNRVRVHRELIENLLVPMQHLGDGSSITRMLMPKSVSERARAWRLNSRPLSSYLRRACQRI